MSELARRAIAEYVKTGKMQTAIDGELKPIRDYFEERLYKPGCNCEECKAMRPLAELIRIDKPNPVIEEVERAEWDLRGGRHGEL